jgi:hypothetical protein
LARPCPGRGKLGDGTVGAVATHTTDSYHHVAGSRTIVASILKHQRYQVDARAAALA